MKLCVLERGGLEIFRAESPKELPAILTPSKCKPDQFFGGLALHSAIVAISNSLSVIPLRVCSMVLHNPCLPFFFSRSRISDYSFHRKSIQTARHLLRLRRKESNVVFPEHLFLVPIEPVKVSIWRTDSCLNMSWEVLLWTYVA